MGAGALSLGASAIFSLLRSDAIKSLEAQCSPSNRTLCPDTANVGSLRNQVSVNTTLANVTLGVGAAALLGGGIWWFLEANRSTSPSRAELQIAPTQGGAVVTISGAL
jgi:hypothetical protein